MDLRALRRSARRAERSRRKTASRPGGRFSILHGKG